MVLSRANYAPRKHGLPVFLKQITSITQQPGRILTYELCTTHFVLIHRKTLQSEFQHRPHFQPPPPN